MHFSDKQTKIYVYAMPVMDSRMYIIPNDQNKNEALIIDPVCHDEAIPIIKKFSHAIILLTHSHYDHISGVNWLRTFVRCTLFCSQRCSEKISNPHDNFSAFATALIMGKTAEEQARCMEFFDLNYTCHADETFDNETNFDFGSYNVKIKHTPGHSDCSQCIRLSTNKKELTTDIIFTGDSLVNGHETITRLPSGSRKNYNTITKPYLESLPKNILVMPGHGDWGRKNEIH